MRHIGPFVNVPQQRADGLMPEIIGIPYQCVDISREHENVIQI
jgi:hypothetical protein